MNRKELYWGSFLTMFSAVLWGVSGAVGQCLFRDYHFTPQWLVSTRMLASGILMLGVLYFRKKKEIFSIFKNRIDTRDMILFALFGMLATQFTYFVAISESNAATATVLQYLAPVIIVVYTSGRLGKRATVTEIVAVNAALLGTFILATHGDPKSLTISKEGLFWGIASAVALAFYSMQPKRLLSKYHTLTLIGWAMLIGGLAISFFYPPWETEGVWNDVTIWYVLFIILFGTLIPYSCYLLGIKIVGATKASLFASLEPVSSTIVSVAWLGVQLADVDYWGFVLILATVFLLSIPFPKKKQEEDEAETNNMEECCSGILAKTEKQKLHLQ